MRQRLSDLIARGADIELSCRGVMYTILPWTFGGISIGPQGDDHDQLFPHADAMFAGYLIDGIALGDLMDAIEIEFSS